MIKAVFIDIDDTVFSFSGFVKKAMRDGFEKFGLKPYTDEMYPIFEKINNELWRRVELNKLTIQQLCKIRWNMIFERINISFDGTEFENYFCEELHQSAVFEPHALELLNYLKDGYILCAASNGPYEQQYNRLKVGGIDTYFSHIFISSAIGAKKPDKEFFDYCFSKLRRSGCDSLLPEETIIIGDSLTSDIAGGRNYGMKTCLYTKGKEYDSDYKPADYIVSDLSDIMKIL